MQSSWSRATPSPTKQCLQICPICAPLRSVACRSYPRFLANQGDSGSELIVPILLGGRAGGTLDMERDRTGYRQPTAQTAAGCGRAPANSLYFSG